MKKQYIQPSVEEIKIETTSMLATSSLPENEATVNTDEDGVQFGRDDRPSNPNLWDKQW